MCLPRQKNRFILYIYKKKIIPKIGFIFLFEPKQSKKYFSIRSRKNSQAHPTTGAQKAYPGDKKKCAKFKSFFSGYDSRHKNTVLDI
jgi:hypothetical protein